MSFRKLILTFTMAVAAGALAGCGSDSKTAKPSYLFSFEGDNAALKPVPGSTSKFTFALPIDADAKVATWFTDRPNRDAGIIKISELAGQWSKSGPDSFKSDPPNVSLIYGTDTKPLTLIATMSDVKIVPSQKTGQESFEAVLTVIPESDRASLESSEAHLAAHAKRAKGTFVAPTPALTQKVAVFIDPEVGLSDS